MGNFDNSISRALKSSSTVNRSHMGGVLQRSTQWVPDTQTTAQLRNMLLQTGVQQRGVIQRQSTNSPPPPSVPDYTPKTGTDQYSTPIPGTFKEVKNEQQSLSHEGEIKKSCLTFNVKILPDKHLREGDSHVINGETINENGGITTYKQDFPDIQPINGKQENGRVVSFDPLQNIVVNYTIQTTYGKNADKSRTPTYGVGSTLKEHEGSHGTDYINYLMNSKCEFVFEGTVGMTVKDFLKAWDNHKNNIKSYLNSLNGMNCDSKIRTDHFTC